MVIQWRRQHFRSIISEKPSVSLISCPISEKNFVKICIWGRISSGEEYQMDKNFKWRRISSAEENQVLGSLSSGGNIKWGSISNGEEF